MRILLIAGGWSSERDVSLAGAKSIEAALNRLGHQTTFFDPAASLHGLMSAAKTHDFACINLHGSPGEDGLIQAVLDAAGCPYQGSGPAGSFLALNKAASKEIFRDRGLNTPDWIFLAHEPGPEWTPNLPFPLFVKSNIGGSSLDLYRADDQPALMRALRRIFAAGHEVIIEPLVAGKEITCGVLGNPGTEKALPPVLILPNSGSYFDYQSKYQKNGATELCPAPVAASVAKAVQQAALAAHRALGLRGYSRSDFILREDGVPMLLEVNTLPGMTGTSLVPQEAAAIGLSFEELIAKLIELGLEYHAK